MSIKFISVIRVLKCWMGSYLQENKRYIGRAVFDEAQQLLVSNKFRPAFNAIPDTYEIPIPRLYVSATLPPALMDLFIKLAKLPPLPRTKIIRAPTNRLEHSYQLMLLPPKSKRTVQAVVSLLARLVQQELLHIDMGDRGIIFVRTMNMANELLEVLGLCSTIYYSKMEVSEKMESVQAWRDGQTPWMIATTAFIQGVDYPRVQSIIFADLPYGMIDFVQGAGRGGRTCSPTSIYLVANQDSGLMESDSEAFVKCYKPMNCWKNNQRLCRRYHISECMDGDIQTCHSLKDAVKCDICCPDSIYTRLGKQALSGDDGLLKHQVWSNLLLITMA